MAAATVERALTEFAATLTMREARAIAFEQSAGAPIVDAVAAVGALRQDGRLLELADGRLTTRAHRAAERATVAAAQELAAAPVEPILAELVGDETERLAGQLAEQGAELTDEQRQAIAVGCSARPLVVIEGQAGSGKSTVLQAIARAHQAEGQLVVVTSTAALAARRLNRELEQAGVSSVCFSTVGLIRAVQAERLSLSSFTTVIHDEAALASTRELRPLLEAAQAGGARVILVGDPRQSHAVGAGGLWPHLEAAAVNHDAHVELSHNVRAREPADRRDQRRFRDGQAELALRGYAARQRVHLSPDQTEAEDLALDLAQCDRQLGLRTLIIAQTSNDHLDELNARAQAIRMWARELGPDGLALAGRPYELYAGDDLQIRHTIDVPEYGPLRNGTGAHVVEVDPDGQRALVSWGDESPMWLSRERLDQAQARLAYVQHPFPAQGLTSDTTHLIVTDHNSREGSYVALTRARGDTHVYAGEELLDAEPDRDPIARLAEHLGHEEPDLPSIALPLALEPAGYESAEPELAGSEGLERRTGAEWEGAGRDGGQGPKPVTGWVAHLLRSLERTPPEQELSREREM